MNTTTSCASTMLDECSDGTPTKHLYYTPKQAAQRRKAAQIRMHKRAVKSSCAKWFMMHAERHGVMLV